MPAKILMSWKPDTRRWKKMYRGKMYIVSCRKLGVAETKEASWKAANEWFLEQKRIADQPPEDGGIARAIQVERLILAFNDLDEESRIRAADSLMGAGVYRRLVAKSDEADGAATQLENRAVDTHVETWRQLLLSNCESKQISAGRYEAYVANIAKFVAWIGPKTAIDAIDESKIEQFYASLSALVAKGDYAPATAHGIMLTAKQFISWLSERRTITAPGNLRSRRLRFNHGTASEIETFTVDEIRAILAACDQFSERTKLYVLLSIGAGMYQMDIAELRQDEVDWESGFITRVRTKTRNQKGMKVTYKLWPETFELLNKYRAKKSPLALTTGEGNPLARRWVEDGKTRRYDLIGSAWDRLAKRMGIAKHRLGMKHLRKTAASILGTHPQFKYHSLRFLAHSPKGVSEKHYVIPSDAEFFDALDWLRSQILGEESS